jgi:hypothetical protein
MNSIPHMLNEIQLVFSICTPLLHQCFRVPRNHFINWLSNPSSISTSHHATIRKLYQSADFLKKNKTIITQHNLFKTAFEQKNFFDLISTSTLTGSAIAEKVHIISEIAKSERTQLNALVLHRRSKIH